jgi:hypothetical protein
MTTNPPQRMGGITIAFMLIVSFILFIAIVIIFNYYHNTLDIHAIELVGAIWGPWVGTILGYYFGSRSSEALTDDNKNLSTQLGAKDQKLSNNKYLMQEYRTIIDINHMKLRQLQPNLKAANLAVVDLQTYDDIVNDLGKAKNKIIADISNM